MNDAPDEYQKLLEQKRFLGEVEQGIRLANREIIHKNIPSIDKDGFLVFAVAVGRLRAHYLEAAFKFVKSEHGELPKDTDISELCHRREMYEETCAAFDALREAIEKGYVDVDMTGT